MACAEDVASSHRPVPRRLWRRALIADVVSSMVRLADTMNVVDVLGRFRGLPYPVLLCEFVVRLDN